MTGQDKKAFAVFMATLATVFDKTTLTEEKVAVYFEALRDLPIHVIEYGVREILRTRRYPSLPMPADIREIALGGDDQTETAALAAWSTIVQDALSFRQTRDPRILEAVVLAFGSWGRFEATDPAMEASDRAHFIRCYKAIERRRRTEGLLPAPASTKQLPRGEQTQGGHA